LRVLVSWLRDFVTVPVDIDELAHTLSMRGFEVAAVEPLPAGTTGEPDAVIDLEITANRPDCMSMLGIAREVATAFALPLRRPGLPDAAATSRAEDSPPVEAGLSVHLDDQELCPRYAASVEAVEVGPSPAWVTNRLTEGGIRPINNIVDVTNYVLLELGHPMHAFDLERLAGQTIRIRVARPNERIVTLDGVERTLQPGMLVIADAERPQAVAGVMGGLDSEVHARTRLLALESAWFSPPSVRRTSKRVGLKTEASVRFERGADIQMPVAAIERARELLAAIGASRGHGLLIDRYPEAHAPREILLRQDRIGRLLGQKVEAAEVLGILERLGFSAVRDGDAAWRVAVPSWRLDVTREIDLIEEVGRHHGYDRLPTTFPALHQPAPPPDARIAHAHLARQVLAAAGCFEAMTFAFIERQAAAPFGGEDEIVPIANPLSEKFAVLRPSMLPGLVDSIAHNRRRERDDVRLFEVGSRFRAATGETRAVGLAMAGHGLPEHWSGGGRPLDLFDLTGIVVRLCEAFGVAPEVEPAPIAYLVEGRSAIVRTDGRLLGVLGLLLPDIASARGLTAGEVYVAELDFDELAAVRAGRGSVRVRPLPRHPSIVRDLSVLVDDTLPAATVRGTIRSVAPGTLESLREFARYQGPGVPEGRISLSWRLTFRAPDRTLTDAEVQQAIETILEALQRTHDARLR
jgi:phenylalanyl-tRNA synthetase beta chain